MKTLTEPEIFYSMNGIVARRSRLADAKILAPKLSEHDKHEAWAVSHLKPLEALELGLKSSIFAFTVENNGNVIAMGGIIPDDVLGNRAQIFFLASDELSEIGRVFLSNIKSILNILFSYYKILYNYVHVDSKKSIQWMVWAGAKIFDPEPFGIENEMFHYFEFRKS